MSAVRVGHARRKAKKRAVRREAVIRVRSGASVGHSTSLEAFPKVTVITVSGGNRPLLWLGANLDDETGIGDGIAWVSGRDTLRRVRDAIDAALNGGEGG